MFQNPEKTELFFPLVRTGYHGIQWSYMQNSWDQTVPGDLWPLYIETWHCKPKWYCPAHPIWKPGGFLGNLAFPQHQTAPSGNCIVLFAFCSCLHGSEVHTWAWVGLVLGDGGGVGILVMKILKLFARNHRGCFYWNRKKCLWPCLTKKGSWSLGAGRDAVWEASQTGMVGRLWGLTRSVNWI